MPIVTVSEDLVSDSEEEEVIADVESEQSPAR